MVEAGPPVSRRKDLQEQKDNPEDHTDVSLFDGILQEIIRESSFEINSGTEEEANYTIILENTSDAVLEMDTHGVIQRVNPAGAKLFDSGEEKLLGTSFVSLVMPDYREGFRKGMEQAAAIHRDNNHVTTDDILVFRALGAQGGPLSMEGIFYSYMKDGFVVLVLLMRDLNFSRRLYDELREARDHYNALSETISETIIRLDDNFNIIFANSAVQKTFGFSRDEVSGQHFSMLFPPGGFQRNQDTFRKYFFVDDQHRKDLGLDITIEMLGKSKHRGLFPLEMSFGNSKEFNGRTMTCILRDITQRKHNERRLRHLAYHDKLTGLGNRDLFNSDLQALLQGLKEHPEDLYSLLFLDLDGFKQVNDTLGHKAGDALLVETAKRLRNTVRETDAVYRFGGDEFVVLLHTLQEKDNAAMIGGKLLASVQEPYLIDLEKDSTRVNVGVSIGAAIIPTDGEYADIITKHADLAMYSAKSAGKNTFVFYSREMDKRAMERWDLEQGLKNGLSNGDFTLYYQPVVDKNGTILGVESLIRWPRGDRGFVSPSTFIPAAEETGLIIPLSNWVLDTACRKIHYINSQGYRDLFVSVNISPKQFEHPGFLENTIEIIDKTVIQPKNLKLELTETCIMSNPESAIEKMHILKNRYPGLSIAIDDFGTGYSSLSYLSRFPADIIKIDLSFVTKLFQGSNQKIVNAILNLAKSLNMQVVAEGVETKQQLDFFITQKCGLLQGFFFHKPLDFEDLRKVLSEKA
ncbi:MAG: EAL domain-containing protein [Spirochaetales bacterium]|nr:EAL domain-containing protein [Spirochaetales bacterium]